MGLRGISSKPVAYSPIQRSRKPDTPTALVKRSFIVAAIVSGQYEPAALGTRESGNVRDTSA
jgi:hypothetical protein